MKRGVFFTRAVIDGLLPTWLAIFRRMKRGVFFTPAAVGQNFQCSLLFLLVFVVRQSLSLTLHGRKPAGFCPWRSHFIGRRRRFVCVYCASPLSNNWGRGDGTGGLLTNHLRPFSPFSLLSQFLVKADPESMAVLVLQAAANASLRSV
jgi:hypothetical protein